MLHIWCFTSISKKQRIVQIVCYFFFHYTSSSSALTGFPSPHASPLQKECVKYIFSLKKPKYTTHPAQVCCHFSLWLVCVSMYFVASMNVKWRRRAKCEFSLPAKAWLQYLCLKFHPLHNLFLLFLASCKFFMELLPFPDSVTNE